MCLGIPGLILSVETGTGLDARAADGVDAEAQAMPGPTGEAQAAAGGGGAAGVAPMARVDMGGFPRDVCLAYVPEAAVGDYVLVHVGFAVRIMDADEAHGTFELLRSAGVDLAPAARADVQPAGQLP